MTTTRTTSNFAWQLAGLLLVTLSALAPVTALAQDNPSTGPDVVVFDLFDTTRWGSSGNTTAYSVGTESCNRGTAPVSWVSSNNQHPVIGQNLYRLKGGRLEQVGMSWLKHGFASVNGSSCGTCQQPPGGSSQLGVGCSDPYWATLNGDQNLLGPRSEVNAFTGAFPYPPTPPSGTPVLAGRLQVATGDVDPNGNPGALYFVEGQYVTADDAVAGNGLNNVSYRQVTVNASLDLLLQGTTQEATPAIAAWSANDPAVSLATAGVPGEGRFTVAFKTVDNGNGTWRYEVAIHNLNSDRSAQSLTVPIPPGTVVTNVGFHDVAYHSGEPYDGTDWPATVDTTAGFVRWSTTDYATNPNANALRFGTMYNFWFDASAPPRPVTATVGLFKPGTPVSLDVLLFGSATLFADGFESGSTLAWTATVP
jgi:hypothetical protein